MIDAMCYRYTAGEAAATSAAAAAGVAAASSTPAAEDRGLTALDQLLTEMCRYCDRDCGPGETSAQLKARLKRAILTIIHK